MKNNPPLFKHLKFLTPGQKINQGFTEESKRPRDWEKIYRNRWGHDKIVRSTHGVNCTGSCSWKIYVKDGIITSETQQTDYPSTGGEDFPEYEPRGCPRGASFSWYTYSPVRVKYPYIRGDLYAMWKEEREIGQDAVQAWKNITENPKKRDSFIKARGKGGFVRAEWQEVCEIIASATIATIQKYGPDRIVGFSPIPAMSMVSYAGGTRFLSLIGGTILSFYDWYADLPPASPQVWGGIKRTYQKALIGTTLNILLFGGEQIYHRREHQMLILWWRLVTMEPKWLVLVLIMQNTKSLQIFGCQLVQVQMEH